MYHLNQWYHSEGKVPITYWYSVLNEMIWEKNINILGPLAYKD